jgi:hypothetical protein
VRGDRDEALAQLVEAHQLFVEERLLDSHRGPLRGVLEQLDLVGLEVARP